MCTLNKLIHVTLIPYLKASGELKTKPTQASVKDLQGMGIQPDILVCRSEQPLDEGNKNKIALFCNVPPHHVLQKLDVDVLYEVPLVMEQEHLAQSACECLNLPCLEPDLTDWQNMIGLIICIFHAWDCKQYLCLFQHHTGHGGNVFSNHIHSIVVHNAGAFLLAKAHCHHFAWPALISSAKRIISSAKRIVGLKPAGYDNAVRFICIPVNKHPSASLRNPKLHHLHGGADRASHGFRGNIIACQHLQLSLCRSAPMASHGRHAGELYLCIYPHHPLPVLAINTIHALICGLLFAGIISATMSSSDSDLLGAGSIFANDIYKAVLKPDASSQSVMTVTKVVMCLVGVASMLIALFNTQSSVSILMFCFTLRAAGSFFPYVMGHYWKKASTAGTIASLIAGTVVVVYLEHVSKGMLFGIKFSQPIIPGLVAAFICFVIFSYAMPPKVATTELAPEEDD